MYRAASSTFVFFFIISLLFAQNDYAPNQIDSLGLKQGLWIELEAKPDIIGVTHFDLEDGTSVDKMKYNYRNYVVLKYIGLYEDGLRSGVWKVYSSDESIRYKITFKGGLVYGPFVMYHPNGEKKLEGYIERKTLTTVSYFDEKGAFIKSEEWYTSRLIERLNR